MSVAALIVLRLLLSAGPASAAELDPFAELIEHHRATAATVAADAAAAAPPLSRRETLAALLRNCSELLRAGAGADFVGLFAEAETLARQSALEQLVLDSPSLAMDGQQVVSLRGQPRRRAFLQRAF